MKQHWKTNKGKFKGEVGVWEPENQRRKSPQERNTFSTDIVPEKAILVSVCDSKTSMERTEECLNELAFLLETAGGVPVKTVIQKLDHPDSRTYIGSGKLEEVIEYKNVRSTSKKFVDITKAEIQLLSTSRKVSGAGRLNSSGGCSTRTSR